MINNPNNFFDQIQNLCEELGLKMKAISESVAGFVSKSEVEQTYLKKDEANASFLGKDAKAASASYADSASRSTSADTATKAIQDADGATIATTYLKSSVAQSTYLGKTAKAASATTADTATKAEQDGNGANIASTYLTKTDAASMYLGKTSKAESATTADTATTADSATKATQDGNGANIASTYVKTVNGASPVGGNVTVDVTLTKDKVTDALGYTPLETAPVTSVNGMTGEVTIEDSASGRGVGRGGVNVHFSVASYNTYTVPSSGIITITCSCNSDGVDVYSNGAKLFTQSYTDRWQEDDGGDAGSGTTVYQAEFTIPVNANEVIGIVYKNKDYNRLYNGKYVERVPFSGSLMQLVVV